MITTLVDESEPVVIARMRPPTPEPRSNVIAYASAYAEAHGWPRIAWQMAFTNEAAGLRKRRRR